jgi:hypothetical protein
MLIVRLPSDRSQIMYLPFNPPEFLLRLRPLMAGKTQSPRAADPKPNHMAGIWRRNLVLGRHNPAHHGMITTGNNANDS